MHQRSTRFVMTVLAAALVAACGKHAAGGPGGPETNDPNVPLPTYDIIRATPDRFFAPTPLYTTVGHPITFSFDVVAHNVYFAPLDGAPANIEGANSNITVSRTFTATGTFRYACHIHPTMTGVVIVE
jgi:plastocyanin